MTGPEEPSRTAATIPRSDAPRARLGSGAGRAIIAAAVLGSALAYMSDDMLNVALSTVSRDLAVNVTEMQWIVNGYFVTMLSLMLTAGSIGDIRGHRRMFLWGLAVFSSGARIRDIHRATWAGRYRKDDVMTLTQDRNTDENTARVAGTLFLISHAARKDRHDA